MLKQHVQQRCHRFGIDSHAPHPSGNAQLCGHRWNVEAIEKLVEERLMFLGEELVEGFAVDTTFVGADELLWYEEVDAVWLSVGFGFDPRKVDVELLGAVCDGAEHTAPTGVGHCGDDVAAVAKGKDRQIDSNQVRGSRVHRPYPPVLGLAACE